jgi:branched-chain amino acid transport system ATP-binding protein
MSAVLEIVGVRKTLAPLPVLAGFDLVLDEGALFGLVGLNGSGKTTVLNVIGGPAIADVGRIRLAGREIGSLPTWARAAAGLGRTFQASRLWPDLTVREHCLIAMEAATRSGAELSLESALKWIELPANLLDALPGRLRLLDRRLVELGLAMLNATQVLLVDEIGAGLNAEEAQSLYQLINEMVRQRRPRAAILVEHRLDLLAGFASEIGLLEGGAIRARARPDRADEMQRLIERMVRVPAPMSLADR